MPFKDDGTPKPLIFVGENGSGKTNFLSIVADALFEAASAHFLNAVNNAMVNQRPWFRVVGSSTISAGCAGSCAILQFEDKEAAYFYREKGGILSASEIMQRIPESLKPAVNWQSDSASDKKFLIENEPAKQIFQTGAYLYFPSNRAEKPHWLNQDSLPTENFNTAPRFERKLDKPIYVERGLDKLKQWMLSVLLSARVDIQWVEFEQGKFNLIGAGDPNMVLLHQKIWESLNVVLQIILNDPNARFVWAGQFGNGIFGFEQSGRNVPLPIESLSAGQATLLNIFGTLLRYGAGTNDQALLPEVITGLCIVDEIDAHMHIDLQYRGLPQLIKMFPKVQFILSSHSPLFVLGMDKLLGDDGMGIINMPDGIPIQAESYSEFGQAFQVLQDTKAFNKAVLDTVIKNESKLLVFLEGETDLTYFATAIELLNRQDLNDKVEFECIGSKNKQKQAFNTGKDALDAAYKFLSTKQSLMSRPVLLLYDNDAKRENKNSGRVYVRSVPSNPDNTIILHGIENLLPELVFTNDMYDENEERKPNGDIINRRTLKKVKLCTSLCEKNDTRVFEKFQLVFQVIDELVSEPSAVVEN